VRTFAGRSLSDCPFRYQGQYEDQETGLYYNRFRYYDPSIGAYLSQDPIRINGNNPTLYAYVHNPNYWNDIFALIIVYRNIPPGGSISGGISARCPGRGMTPTGHIIHGSSDTFKGSQYISATTDPAVVQKWKQEGQMTVCFDTDDVVADAVGNKSVLNVSTPELATSNGIKGKTAINFASSSKEVLIEGHIPENKIKVMNDSEIETAKKLHGSGH
jgi:RHS repeat-associated protein